MARLAQSQANYCARVRRLVHSDRYAFRGGENLWGGSGNPNPMGAVRGWLHSKAGHREYLLSPRITKAGVGIAKRNGFTCVAFAFSDAPPSYPDCSYYKPKTTPIQLPNPLKILTRRKMRMPTNPFKIGVSLVLGTIGFIGMALGVHGVYVYFNRLDLILGGEGAKLFLVLDVPIRFRDLIMWASARGLQSWVIPVLIFIGGLWLFNFSRVSAIVSRILSKIQP